MTFILKMPSPNHWSYLLWMRVHHGRHASQRPSRGAAPVEEECSRRPLGNLRVLDCLGGGENEADGRRLHRPEQAEEGLDVVVVGTALLDQHLPEVVGGPELGHNVGALKR